MCTASDYRAKGKTGYKAMTLGASELIRRFLLHVLPTGFHCIRYYAREAAPQTACQAASAISRVMTRIGPCRWTSRRR